MEEDADTRLGLIMLVVHPQSLWKGLRAEEAKNVATARDVAAYIRQSPHHGRVQLLKLVYYSQAWNLAWTGNTLFDDPIEAWQGGPVVRGIWAQYRYYGSTEHVGDPKALTVENRAVIDAVIEFYGRRSGQALSELTHGEAPWRDAYKQGQNSEITTEAMLRFYSRQSLEGTPGPNRPMLSERRISDEEFEALTSAEMERWRETLDLLAQ